MFQEETTITLVKPVTLNAGAASRTLTELKLREPTAGELEKAVRADTSIGVTINLIKEITGESRPMIEKLCRRDLQAASDFFEQLSSDGAAIETDGSTESAT
jgi:Phage tail assembly chaperone proteins, E, or 41 or 14